MAPASLGMIAVPEMVFDQFPQCLKNEIGEDVRRVSERAIAELASQCIPMAGGKPQRALWLALFPDGSIHWPERYLVWLAKHKEGRRKRLSDHEMLLDLLASRVASRCWQFYQASKPLVLLGRCYSIFSVLPNTGKCPHHEKTFWPVSEHKALWSKVLTCEEIQCCCSVHFTSKRNLQAYINMGYRSSETQK